MRGAVSLAAALALPQSFPERDLLVFLTFCVIVATLVGQGLTLPPLIRRLGLVTRDEQDRLLTAEARRRLTVVALAHIDDLGQTDQFPGAVVERLRTGYESQLARIDRQLEVIGADNPSDRSLGDTADNEAQAEGFLQAERDLRLLVIASERTELDHLLARRRITTQVADQVRAALDVDETTMRP
jgi:CPA1 family monovalent cation:H+ antiporter